MQGSFLPQETGIPGLGLVEGFQLVVHQEHEGIGADLGPFLILVLLFANVGDELSV